MRWLVLFAALVACTANRPAPRAARTPAAEPVPTARGVEARTVKERGTWRMLGAVTIPAGSPAGTVSHSIGVRLGGFPHLALTSLTNSVSVKTVTLFADFDRRGAQSFSPNATVDATNPTLVIKNAGEGIEWLEIAHDAVTADVTIEVAGFRPFDDDVTGDDLPPATLAGVMLFASKQQHRLDVGIRHRTFTWFFMHTGSACLNVRVVTLAFVGGGSKRFVAPPRVPDEYGNWPDWGIELPGNKRHIASAGIEYTLDPAHCDHASFSLVGR